MLLLNPEHVYFYLRTECEDCCPLMVVKSSVCRHLVLQAVDHLLEAAQSQARLPFGPQHLSLFQLPP